MKKLMLISILMAGAACATSPTQQQATTARNEDNPLLLTALAESALPEGKCGMILWTLEGERPTPILRYVAGEGGEIAVNGAPATLTLNDASGVSAFGVFEKQSFTSDAGLTAAVAVRFGLGFDGGSYLERGLVTIEAEDGWRLSAPAAGIAGCRG